MEAAAAPHLLWIEKTLNGKAEEGLFLTLLVTQVVPDREMQDQAYGLFTVHVEAEYQTAADNPEIWAS